MLRTFALIILLLAVAVAIYAAALASWSLARDSTLTRVGRACRYVAVWGLPFIGAGWVLRSAADLAPESLPPHGLLRLLVPLFYISRVQYNALADRNDLKALGGGSGIRNDIHY
jgi:hypothetical protein